jgi:hypothetical protein
MTFDRAKAGGRGSLCLSVLRRREWSAGGPCKQGSKQQQETVTTGERRERCRSSQGSSVQHCSRKAFCQICPIKMTRPMRARAGGWLCPWSQQAWKPPLNSRIADGVRLGGCHHVRSAFRRLVWTSLSPHTATNQPSPCFPAAVGCRRKINTSISLST